MNSVIVLKCRFDVATYTFYTFSHKFDTAKTLYCQTDECQQRMSL